MAGLEVKLSHLMRRRRGRRSVRSARRSSSPSRPEDLGGKSLCFWALNQRRETEWYIFRLSNDGSIKKAMKKYRKILQWPNGIELVGRHGHRQSGDNKSGREILSPITVTKNITTNHRRNCVAMGSVIYRVGGDRKRCNEVICFDLSCPERGWTKCPPMINPRRRACAVTLDGKLYVMGGSAIEEPAPWAEVYDPCLRKWEELPPPPPPSPAIAKRFFSSLSVCAAIEASKKILVTFERAVNFYLYDASNNSWRRRSGVEAMYDESPATVVDHTVYWLHGSQLKAFDSDRKMWLEGFIEGLECEYHINHKSDDALLLHIGGDEFCVFWVNCDDVPAAHSVKIRISKCHGGLGGQGTLNAFVESCQSYDFDRSINFLDARLLDEQFIWEKKLPDESASAEVVGEIEGS